MILGKSILCYSTPETILVYLVSETRKMLSQNRTPKKSNQLWELVLTSREAIIVGRPFWPPINERRASCAPPSTASCLRPTFTRFTYSPKPWPHAVFASSNESFGVRWEAERHTAFLRFASIANHLAHWEHIRSVKAPSPLRFAGAVQKSVTKRCRRIDSGDNSQTTFLRIPQTLRKK
jgi:hypothetical protein